jgi:hypothetical protein
LSASLALGVLQFAARPFNSSSFDLTPERLFRPPSMSATLGVGHCLLAVTRLGPPSLFALSPEPFVPSLALAVGQDPEPLALMRRTDVRSAEQCRRHAVAHCFQVSNDILEAKRDVARDVLEEAERRRDLLDDSSDVGPEVAGIVSTSASARKAEGLAGVTSSDEIHSAAPRSAVEG